MKTSQAESTTVEISPGLRRFLYLTAAITGGIILIVEILGAKMLSPFFGTSHFVWTAQIAVTLLSLAAGYYYGGWLVDRSTNLKRLYFCILLAGVYLCTSLPFLRPMAFFFLKFSLALGSVLASLFLFFIPLTLLAVTGPFVIRVLTESTHTVGGQVGRLSAVSTVGSVLGTVLIGYVLIPFAPNTVTMLVSAGVLFTVVGVYFLVWHRQAKTLTQAGTLLVLAIVAGIMGVRIDANSGTRNMTELTRRNSNFGLMQVLENKDGTRRFYLNDLLTQNIYDPVAKQSLTVFTYMLHDLATAYTSEIKSLLGIGLGVGIVPRQFATEGVAVDVVEINPRVVDIGSEYFDFVPEKVNIHIGDGRHYLNATDKHYDVILLDAFLGDSSPSHLMTRECFQSIQQKLNADGVLVINSFGYFRKGEDFFVSSLAKTLKSVFASVKIHDGGHGNVFFVASDQKELSAPRRQDFSHAHPLIRRSVSIAYENVVTSSTDRGIVLRDDFNPVDYYDAKVREGIRKSLALSMKK